MIRSLYMNLRARRLLRELARHEDTILARERATSLAHLDRLEAMAAQLAEIRALPEVLELWP